VKRTPKTPDRPTYRELIARGAKIVSRGGQHEVLCDSRERHWLTDHRYRPDERDYIQRRSEACWCKKDVPPAAPDGSR
jgi:hypothetical protein